MATAYCQSYGITVELGTRPRPYCDGRSRCVLGDEPPAAPGTLTITYGDASVTVDPSDSRPAFDAKAAAALALLDRAHADWAPHLRASRGPLRKAGAGS